MRNRVLLGDAMGSNGLWPASGTVVKCYNFCHLFNL